MGGSSRRKIGPGGDRYSRGWAGSLSLEDARELLNGFVAYYGGYDIDETQNTVTHHVQGELRSALVGTERLPKIQFLSSDRIALTYALASGENRLVWEREGR